MTVEEYARPVGIGRTAAYEAVRRGEIPSIRVGKRILIPTALARAQLGLPASREEAGATNAGPVLHLNSTHPSPNGGSDAHGTPTTAA